jgi:hypothetical protein
MYSKAAMVKGPSSALLKVVYGGKTKVKVKGRGGARGERVSGEVCDSSSHLTTASLSHECPS